MTPAGLTHARLLLSLHSGGYGEQWPDHYLLPGAGAHIPGGVVGCVVSWGGLGEGGTFNQPNEACCMQWYVLRGAAAHQTVVLRQTWAVIHGPGHSFHHAVFRCGLLEGPR
jgi:hypothetical protein